MDYYAFDRSEMLAFIPNRPTKVLELGCAKGNFGALLKAIHGCSVCGIDICAEALVEAKTKLDETHLLDVDHLDFSMLEKDFDLIVANDVLEHLQHPWALVEKLHDHLVPGGYFVSSIPNVRYYRVGRDLIFKGVWNYAEAGILDRTHLRFFTEKTMPGLFKDYRNVQVLPAFQEKVPISCILKYVISKLSPDMFVQQYAVIAQK